MVRLMVCFALDRGENLICFSSSVSVKPAVNPASPGPIHSSFLGLSVSGEFGIQTCSEFSFKKIFYKKRGNSEGKTLS